MKKYLGILFLTSIYFAAKAQDKYYQPYMTKSLSADAINKVKVETAGGSIEVKGADVDAHIDVFVSPNNNHSKMLSKEEIERKISENYDLSVNVVDHQLTAIAKSKKKSQNWKDGLNISFKIIVPSATSVNLLTSGGNIELADLKGKLDFTTSGGNLNLEHIGGNVNGTTSGGNINIKHSADDIELTTSGGNVNAVNSHGNIRLSTSGGNVGVNNSGGTIRATTSGGDVLGDTVDGELIASTSGGDVRLLNLSCSLDAGTSGGNIRVSMAALGKYVKISNSGGNTDIEMPQEKGVDLDLHAEKIKLNTYATFKGDVEERKVKGTLNGGGVPVTIHGGSGRINLTLR
jgi:hypothetical protein